MLIGSTVLSAVMMKYMLGYNDINGTCIDGGANHKCFSFNAALLYGAIVSATDPVAVVALLKELGAPKQLSTLIEGESLLNDGTAMVVFAVLVLIVRGPEEPLTFPDIMVKFLVLSGGGPILGLIFGVIVRFLLNRIHRNFVLEVNTTIAFTYAMFYIAEFLDLGLSGILALVTFGLYMSYSGKTSISSQSYHALHHVWGYVGFAAETIIFILSGIIIGDKIIVDQFQSQDPAEVPAIDFTDIMKVLAAYVLLHFIRFLMILLFWPALMNMGYGMSFNQVLLGSYAGLRGAVGMSLALMVFADK